MKASTTICRLVFSFLSQFFQSRRHFSSQPKDPFTTHIFGSTMKEHHEGVQFIAFHHFHLGSQQVLHRSSKGLTSATPRQPALSALDPSRLGVGRTSPKPQPGQ